MDCRLYGCYLGKWHPYLHDVCFTLGHFRYSVHGVSQPVKSLCKISEDHGYNCAEWPLLRVKAKHSFQAAGQTLSSSFPLSWDSGPTAGPWDSRRQYCPAGSAPKRRDSLQTTARMIYKDHAQATSAITAQEVSLAMTHRGDDA